MTPANSVAPAFATAGLQESIKYFCRPQKALARLQKAHVLSAGNNAVEMQTTAVYDKVAQEFIVHTPSALAQKYWITNSAVHAKWCVVFAQLLIEGTNHGIHGFLVRIRNEVRPQG